MGSGLKRTFNVEHVNYIVNHEDIREGARLKGTTDFRIPIENVENYSLFNDDGGFIFIKIEPTVYEVHTQFLKRARGPHVWAKTKEAAIYMFTYTPCLKIITQVYKNNLPALKLTRSMEFRVYKDTKEYFLFELTKKCWSDQVKGDK